MRIMVTGGCGFIGSAVIRKLMRDTEHEVLNVDVLTYAANTKAVSKARDCERYSFTKIDVSEKVDIRSLVETWEPDAIMHLAAESHVDRSITGPGTFISTNLIGTYNLLEAARASKKPVRFHHISTDEVFGELGDEGLFHEKTPYDPSSPYSASKAGSDMLVRAWGRTFGLDYVITNCSNNYGPWQFPEKLIPVMLGKALAKAEMPVYGDGKNVRDWLHVEDHAEALVAVMERGVSGETYCVGGSQESTNLDLVHKICDLMDNRFEGTSHRDLIKFVKDRPGHDFRYAIDSSKIQKELGWKPVHDLESGLAHTVDWYCADWDSSRKRFRSWL